jgi:hypothetical protein
MGGNMADGKTEALERLRKEHNAALANGLVLRSRQIARRMDAIKRASQNEEKW